MTEPGWPLQEEAIAKWAARGFVNPATLARLSAEDKSRAWWLAGQWDNTFVDKVQASIATRQLAGGTFSEWLKDDFRPIATDFGASEGLYGSNAKGISRAYADLVFRNATQSALAGGRYAAMFSPEQTQSSPWVMYLTAEDARVRPEHARLHGLVFRKDDMAARVYFPPWDHNCRCYLMDLNQQDMEDGGYKVTNGADIESLETSVGEPVGLPSGGWNVDRIDATVPHALRYLPD